MGNKLLLIFGICIALFLISNVSAVIVRDYVGTKLEIVEPTAADNIGTMVQSNLSEWTLISYNISKNSTGYTHCYAIKCGSTCEILNASDTIYQGILTDTNCSFVSPYPVFPNQSEVYLMLNASNGTVNRVRHAFSMPIIGTNIQFIHAIHGATYSISVYNIENVWTSRNNLTGGVGSGDININLTFPTNKTLSSNFNQTFITNYSYNSNIINATNGTFYMWYNNGTIFNTTNFTLTGAENGTMTIINNVSLGTYNWNYYICGNNITMTHCNWGNEGNYSIDFAGALLNEFYSVETTETASEKFSVNFSLYPGTNFISVLLVYNGTQHIVSDITNYGTYIELKKIIDINTNKNPWKNETKQFYWSFIFSNSGLIQYNTTLRNQVVLPLNILYCNTTYPIIGINFTTYDELNPNPLINSTFHTAWSFWTGNGVVKKNYSFEDTTRGNSSFKFCIFQNYSTIHADLDAEITSTGFWDRTYYLSNATINNITQEVPLRMINSSTGVKFFHTIRKSVTRISNAIIIISKYDVGLGMWITVGIRKSDDVGEFVEYLELDKLYTYSITQNGIFLGSIQKTSTCQATPCTINLELSDTSPNLWQGYYDAFAENVVYNLSYDRTTKNVTFTFIDTSGLAQYFRLEVRKLSSNDTGSLICNKTLYATLGELKCNLTGYEGSFVAKTYISRSPEKFIASLYEILDALADTIGKNEGLLFALITVIVVGLVGAWNPVIGVILSGLAFIFAAIMEFIIMSFTAIILVVILMIILVIKMGKQGV